MTPSLHVLLQRLEPAINRDNVSELWKRGLALYDKHRFLKALEYWKRAVKGGMPLLNIEPVSFMLAAKAYFAACLMPPCGIGRRPNKGMPMPNSNLGSFSSTGSARRPVRVHPTIGYELHPIATRKCPTNIQVAISQRDISRARCRSWHTLDQSGGCIRQA